MTLINPNDEWRVREAYRRSIEDADRLYAAMTRSVSDDDQLEDLAVELLREVEDVDD